jgi:hypothetical protein
MFVVSSESRTSKKHSETVFYLTNREDSIHAHKKKERNKKQQTCLGKLYTTLFVIDSQEMKRNSELSYFS